MRFSPHRTIPKDSISEIENGYDSLSDDSEDDDYHPSTSPFNSSILSSPSKSAFNTPSKSPLLNKTSKVRSLHKVLQSSPLSSSPVTRAHHTPSKLFTQEVDDEFGDDSSAPLTIEDELAELMMDLDFKERYLLIKQNASRRNRQSQSSESIRPNTANYRRNRSMHEPIKITKSADSKTDELTKSVDDFHLKEIQDNVINKLESRFSQRSKDIELRIKQIEEEKKRLEEQRKREEEERRKQEELRRKQEEERRQKEEQERKRKEEELKKHKEEEELKLKEEEAKQAKQQALKLAKEKEEAIKLEREREEEESKKGRGITNFKQVETTFLRYKTMIQQFKTDIVERVKEDPVTKKAVQAHKRKINPKFGQLTNSLTQLTRISTEVIALINETRTSELAFKWILNFVAKAIVSQAETEVRAKASSSLPIGKLTLNLLCEYPELKEFLMARFVKKCPFVIGYSCNVDTEVGRLNMGWKRHDNDKWEDETSYDERMGGMATLYSVITRLPLDPKYFNNLQHPLPLSNSWLFISRILNTDASLLTNAHFIVLNSWWEACAFEFLSNYGKQGKKIMNLIWIDLVNLVKEKKLSGANTVQAIGEDWSTSGIVKRFGDMEP